MCVQLSRLNVHNQHTGQPVQEVSVRIRPSISASRMTFPKDIRKTAQYLTFYGPVNYFNRKTELLFNLTALKFFPVYVIIDKKMCDISYG